MELSKEKPLAFKKLVWVYNAKTLELINNAPFSSMQKCADYFKVDYRTIASNLDTKLAILKNDILVYLFSTEINMEVIHELLITTKKVSNVTTKIWVYRNIDGEFTSIDYNQPFSSKLQASKSLNMSHKTIAKFLDNVPYKGLFFFPLPQWKIKIYTTFPNGTTFFKCPGSIWKII